MKIQRKDIFYVVYIALVVFIGLLFIITPLIRKPYVYPYVTWAKDGLKFILPFLFSIIAGIKEKSFGYGFIMFFISLSVTYLFLDGADWLGYQIWQRT